MGLERRNVEEGVVEQVVALLLLARLSPACRRDDERARRSGAKEAFLVALIEAIFVSRRRRIDSRQTHDEAAQRHTECKLPAPLPAERQGLKNRADCRRSNLDVRPELTAMPWIGRLPFKAAGDTKGWLSRWHGGKHGVFVK